MQVEEIKKAMQFKKAHLNLVQFVLGKGYTISVFCDSEEELIKSNSYKDIKDNIESMDETEIVIYDKENKNAGWAFIIPYNDDEETVSDWTMTSILNEWDNQYQKLVSGLEAE